MGLNRPNIAELAQKFINFRAAGGTVTTTAVPAAQPQETTMAKATKKSTKKIAGTPTRFKAMPGKGKAAAKKTAPAKVSRKDEVIGLLKRTTGATTAQIEERTGMKQHSARALISGIGLTHTVTKTKNGAGATIYSIAKTEAAGGLDKAVSADMAKLGL